MTEFAAEPIAIIGMSARVPGAADLDQFWQNLLAGHDSVTRYTREEQLAIGATPEQLADPSWVSAAQVVTDIEYFDAGLFGMSAREAELADPQLRIFLEQAHAALLNAGYDPARYDGDIGVYAGTGPSQYQWLNIRANPQATLGGIGLGVSVSNNIDYVATTVSYRLNLRGPSMTVSTACSSSLVATHLACEALRSAECDMALAGGVCLEFPHGVGYPALEGFTTSDGHVRPFDAKADGTIWGSGTGVIMLKRLDDALADGDHIRGLILGNAINNDGAGKAGFSAPSVEGQSAVVAEALGVAGVDPRTISYVEAHGTGTALGDPIEVTALSTVYGQGSEERGWCGIGSVKSNIGHLSQASGVVGLIKTVLAMENRMIPPSINYESPNPEIDFASSPFYVVATPTKWLPDDDGPLRAAVSSFGIGGTNAHVVLQQAPEPAPTVPAAGEPRLLRLSARTAGALKAARTRLAEHLTQSPGTSLDDVAHTLAAGRAVYRHRTSVVATDLADAAAALGDAKRCLTGEASDPAPGVALLLSGQGSQYGGMGAELYATQPVFAAAVDECAAIVDKELGEDIRALMFEQSPEADARLKETWLTQPALFVIEYALAKLWQEWGVRPSAMIGHSIGEYVAATLSGVFALPDALRLVCARGRLMHSMPAGSMLAVQKDEKWVAERLPAELSIATVNGPGVCVVAGPTEVVDAFGAQLGSGKKTALKTSHAFHSAMMDPILAEFTEVVASVARQAPQVPFLSNVTGDWITPEQAIDPAYWAAHLRGTVRFADCVATLLGRGQWLLVECGPGRQLAGLARMQVPKGGAAPMASLPAAVETAGELKTLMTTAGRLWAAGVPVELPVTGRRAPLPGYPYEREYHFITASRDAAPAPVKASGPRHIDDWFEVPAWSQVTTVTAGQPVGRCLAFVADSLGEELVTALRAAGTEVIPVRPAAAFGGEPATGFTLRPGERADYDALFAQLDGHGGVPSRIVHAWALAGQPAATDPAATAAAQEHGFFSLLSLTQALAATEAADDVRLDVLTEGTHDVLGADLTRPEHATVAGITKVAPMELDGLRARQLDLDPAGTPVAAVVAELGRPVEADMLALRAGRRWRRDFQPASLPADLPLGALKEGGRYLITGGTGGIGITMAEELGTRLRARLVLVSRSGLREGDPRADRAAAAISRIEAAGGQVLVIAADITDPVRLAEVRDEAVATFGGLDGIIHAAGLPGGGMIEVKERAQAAAVLAPKIAGTLALWEVFGGLGLDFVALCSSVTAVSGGFGQVDYTAANAYLDAFARSMKGGTRVVSLNWGGWLEVGMIADVAAPAALSTTTHTASVPVEHPILRGMTGTEVRGPISAETHWVMDEHRIGGTPVMPGTGQLECARAAFAAAVPAPGPDHRVELRDVAFVKPLAVHDGVTGEMIVAVTGGTDFQVRSQAGVHTSGSAAWVLPAAAERVDVEEIRARLRPAPPENEQMSALTFGPRWREPEQVWLDGPEQLALIEAPDLVAAEVGQWVLHPALLDVATSFGRAPERSGSPYLPLAYGRLRVLGPLPARFYSHLRYREGGGEVKTIDLTLFDESGTVLVEVEEFELRRIDADAVSSSLATPSAESSGWSYAGGGPPVNGIRPVDGVEAFRRALAADTGPQVAVSAKSIAEIIERERQIGAEQHAPAQPERDGDFVAPEGELQTVLATIWGEVLGLPEVAADDDFIELGGNSLVAVQLIAQVRLAVGVRLPMRTLFEAPTIAQMAARIEALRAQESAAPSAAPEPAPIPRVARRTS